MIQLLIPLNNDLTPPISFTDSNGDGNYTGEIAITLEDDDVHEATGEIRVTLAPDHQSFNTYTLGSAQDITDSTNIYDDDAPELSHCVSG